MKLTTEIMAVARTPVISKTTPRKRILKRSILDEEGSAVPNPRVVVHFARSQLLGLDIAYNPFAERLMASNHPTAKNMTLLSGPPSIDKVSLICKS